MNPESRMSNHMEGFGVHLSRGRGTKEGGEGCVTTLGFFFLSHTTVALEKNIMRWIGVNWLENDLQCLSKLCGNPNSVKVVVSRHRQNALESVSTHTRLLFNTVRKK